MAAASQIMKAFHTIRNKPKVSMVIGMVINTITGNKKLLSRAITMATISELQKFLTVVPGKMAAVTIDTKTIHYPTNTKW